MSGTDRTILQARDRAFLKELSIMRVIDHAQAKVVAGFGSTDRANKRLLKLTRAGLLRRFFLGSGGGRKALYSLSEKGARFADVPLWGLRRPQGAVLVADYFVEHQLAVNSIYCAVKFARIPVQGVAFYRWIAFQRTVTSEIRLIPDGYLEAVTPSGIMAGFLEVDLGGERLAVWREKTRKYLQLALSGAHRRLSGRDRFLVFVIANSTIRVESLRKIVAKETQKIFRFTTLEEARGGFFLPVWKRPQGDRPEALISPSP